MNIQELYCFIEAVDSGSFSKAAKRLYISQPAISYQIRNLEKELGGELFVRENTSIRLTELGKMILPDARKVVFHSENLLKLANVAGHTFTVGYANDRASDLTIPYLRTLIRNNPDIQVIPQYLRVVPLREALREGKMDVIITARPSVEKAEDIAFIEMTSSGLLAILPEDHKMANAEQIAFSDLMGEKLYIKVREMFPEEYDIFYEDIRKRKLDVPVVEEKTTEDIFSRVRLGYGVGCLGGGLLRQRLSGVACVPISDSQTVHGVVCAWRKGDRNPLIREFVRCIGYK